MATAVFELSDLNGENGFVINGVRAGDWLSLASSAGDINGDGFADVAMGAQYADRDGKSNVGESYVLFGKEGGFAPSFDLADLDGTNGFVLNGIDAGDWSGAYVSGAGDVNDDGIDAQGNRVNELVTRR